MDEKCSGFTGPALVFLTGCQLSDRARIAVEATLRADEGEASDAAGGRRGVRLVVKAASRSQHASVLANIEKLKPATYMATTGPSGMSNTRGSL